MEAFVNSFREAVLPFRNYLRAISEGSTRFTIQAENSSALEALWQKYQNEILHTNMQEFLVTEEIKHFAGSEVTLTVHIDEEEYRNAKLDLLISETSSVITLLKVHVLWLQFRAKCSFLNPNHLEDVIKKIAAKSV